MERTASYLRKNSNLPQIFESPSEAQTERIHDKSQPTEIITFLPRNQKNSMTKLNVSQPNSLKNSTFSGKRQSFKLIGEMKYRKS